MSTRSGDINVKSLPGTERGFLTIMMGDASCRIRFQQETDYELFKTLYGTFLTDRMPDVTIDLDTTDNIAPEDMEDKVADTVFSHKDNRFRTTSEIVSGHYNLVDKYISITAERHLGDLGKEYNHLNRLITLLYYSACTIKYGNDPFPAMFVHCCAILRKGEIDIFAGPSGIGKTTVAELCHPGDGEVINDEMILMSQPSSTEGTVIGRGAPVIGGTAARSDVVAPVGRIFLLTQSDRTRVKPVNGSAAYLRFIRQVISPAYIGQRRERALYMRMADFSAAIVKHIPVYELEFPLDGDSLWKTVSTVEK